MIKAGLILIFALLSIDAMADEASLSKLQLVTADQRIITIMVERADTPQSRGKGLMARTELPADRGMIFDFKTDQIVYMWMKNTPLSLDMMFIDRTGKILKIHSNTTPYSKNIIQSDNIVRAVLEVVGGFAADHKISVGDQIIYVLFPAG